MAHNNAVELATEQVRATAEGAREELQAILSQAESPTRGSALLEHVLNTFPSDVQNVIVFDSAARPDGSVRIDLAIKTEAGAAGLLGNYSVELVQLCVALSARPGPAGYVHLRNTRCDEAALNKLPWIGPSRKVTMSRFRPDRK